MGEAAEELEALFDFVAREREEPLGTEALDGKRAHDPAVEHGVLEHGWGELGLRCDVAHEASGKGVTCAGGVQDLGDGQSRSTEWVRAVGEKDGGAVFAVLDDQRLGAEGENLLGGEDEAVLVR